MQAIWRKNNSMVVKAPLAWCLWTVGPTQHDGDVNIYELDKIVRGSEQEEQARRIKREKVIKNVLRKGLLTLNDGKTQFRAAEEEMTRSFHRRRENPLQWRHRGTN